MVRGGILKGPPAYFYDFALLGANSDTFCGFPSDGAKKQKYSFFFKTGLLSMPQIFMF